MDDLIITLFLGWAGIHKFMKNETGMGILYLLTGGLFGIGWIIDIIKAIALLSPDKSTDNVDLTKEIKINYHKIFNVAGVTFNCKLDDSIKRQEVLRCCNSKDKLHLEYYEYKGRPAFLIVLDKNNLDIGSVPENLVPTILNYKNWNTSIKFTDISSFETKDSKKEVMYAKVQFLVYNQQKNMTENNTSAVPKRKISYHKLFYLAETHSPCHLDNSKKRMDVIKQIQPDDKYRVENIIWHDIHVQIIVNERLNLDIGMVPQELGITFYQYRNRNTEAIIMQKYDYQIKMQFIVYKE